MFPECLEQLECGVVITRIQEGVEHAVDLCRVSRDVCSGKRKVLGDTLTTSANDLTDAGSTFDSWLRHSTLQAAARTTW